MSIYAVINTTDYIISGIREMRNEGENTCDLLLSRSSRKVEYLHAEKTRKNGKLCLNLTLITGGIARTGIFGIPYGNDSAICSAVTDIIGLVPERRAAA